MTSDETAPTLSTERIEVDSRAMRKILSQEEEVVFVLQTDNAIGSAGVEFAVNLRFLMKEA